MSSEETNLPVAMEEQTVQEMVEPRVSRARLIAIFLCSFLLFLYFTFPYGVLKEYLSSQILQNTGIQVRIGELSPSLPLGVNLSDIEVVGRDERDTIKLQSLYLGVASWRLLLGTIALAVEAETVVGGIFEVDAHLSLFGVMGGNTFPKYLAIYSKEFPIGAIASFGLNKVAESQSQNPIVKELLENIDLRGDLEADIEFAIDVSDPIQSSGNASVTLSKAQLAFIDPAISIQPQNFEIAQIKAEIKNGQLTVDKASRFKSQGLDFTLDGNIGLKDNIQQSTIALAMQLKLADDLKQNYGFLLGSQGELNGEWRGLVGRMEFVRR